MERIKKFNSFISEGGKSGEMSPDEVYQRSSSNSRRNFDAELETGISVEMEHTDDPDEAKRIALDHLAEDPEYYTKLGKAGLID